MGKSVTKYTNPELDDYSNISFGSGLVTRLLSNLKKNLYRRIGTQLDALVNLN